MANNSFKNYIKATQTLYFALLMGQIVFGIVAFVITDMKLIESAIFPIQDILLYPIVMVGIASMASSQIVYRNKLRSLNESASVDEKLEKYRAAIIIRWAILEGSTFLVILLFLLTGDYLLLGMAGLIIGFFAYSYPSENRIDNELGLSWEDKSQLNG